MLKAELGPAAPGPLHHCQAEDHGVGLFLLGWSPLPSPRSPHTHTWPHPQGHQVFFLVARDTAGGWGPGLGVPVYLLWGIHSGARAWVGGSLYWQV